MSPKFFFHKIRETANLLKIMKGKTTGDKKDRVEGVDDALTAMTDEKHEALNQRQPQAGQEKVLRESGGQDISAI